MRYFSAVLLLALGVPYAAAEHSDGRRLGGKSSKSKSKSGSGSGSDSVDDADFKVSYEFPETDTSQFTHGLCVMGAKDAKAIGYRRGSKVVDYEVDDEAFGDGIRLWKDRGYHTSGVDGGAGMCAGGLYLQPTKHKTIPADTVITLSAAPLHGDSVTVCALVEFANNPRDGEWDVELPKNGFTASEKFKWSGNKSFSNHQKFLQGKKIQYYEGSMKSYCKTVTGHAKWESRSSHECYTKGPICARGTGDPHMVTYDGNKYDCQGKGDFIMSKALTEHEFEFQGRFEKVPGKSVTTTQGVVLKTGYAGEPKVEISYTKDCDLTYYLDGTEIDLEDDKDTGYDKVEFYAKNADRSFIFDSGVSLKINMRSYRGDCLLNSYICITPELACKENIVGILGSPDNKAKNDFTKQNGEILDPQPNSRKAKNEQCIKTWCVPENRNLFLDPRIHEECADEFDDVMDKAIDDAPLEVKEACGDHVACIVDVIAADGDIDEGVRTLKDEDEAPAEPPVEDERIAFPAPPKIPPKEVAPQPEEEVTTKSVTPPQKKKASGSGDPHFKTWTGAKFDYHGECDLVLLDNPSFHNGLGLRVHIRTTQVKYFSFIEKVAVQIGDETLEFDNDVENFYINGEHVGQNQVHHKTRLSGFVVRRDEKALSIRLQDEGTKAARQAGLVAKIDLHTRKNGFPAVIMDAGNTDLFKGSLGMLGEFGTGRTLARDGETEVEIDPINAEAFALEWQVRDNDPRLFKESRFPEYPQVCTPPKKMVTNRLGHAKAMEEAKEACAHWKHDVEDCIFDVIATQDVLVAQEGHIVHIE